MPSSSHDRRLPALSLIVASIASLFVVPSASGVHDLGLFELDGNAMDGVGPGDDWSTLFPANTSSAVFSEAFVDEPAGVDTTYFSVSSKDINDVSTWSATGTSAPPKDEIVNAFAATYNDSQHGMIVYFGASRWANNGDSAVGFWFLQDAVSILSGGGFSGHHKEGDTLVVSDFTNGGSVSNISVYKWRLGVPDNLTLVAWGADCGSIADDNACASVNKAATPSPWPYVSSGSHDPLDVFQPEAFFEGGINLTDIFGGAPPCFTNFVTETRSSQETTAVLKDLTLHQFNNCPLVPPESAISVEKTALPPIVNLGENVTFGITVTNSGPDPAQDTIITDDLPGVSGAWSVGGPDAADCTITLLNLTCSFGTVPVEDGTGIGTRSIAITASTGVSPGDCGDHPNTVFLTANGGLANDRSSADVYVRCSDPAVQKVAEASPVLLGENVSFDITVTSGGPDAAEGVTLSDPLPHPEAAWTLGGADAASCSISSGALSCDFGTLGAGETRSVTVTASSTDPAACGWWNNTATVAGTVDTDAGNDDASASVYVACSDVSVDKTAQEPAIYLGQNATFTITLSSNGPDAAENATVTDVLPSAPSAWEIVSSDPSCAIDAGTLTCGFGTVPAGETRSVTLTAATRDAGTTCGLLSNTATVSATVDTDAGNDASTANVTVRCSSVSITKTAGAASVDVGGNASFTITAHSGGPDDAQDVTVSDTLPAISTSWDLGGADAADCGIAAGVLSCSFGTVPAGEDRVVTLTGATGLPDCGDVRNVATVSAAVDTTPDDNEANATEHVRCADVGVAKSSGGDVTRGSNATWNVVVSSLGPDDATDVVVQDVLANGSVLGLSGTAAAFCSESGGTVSCAFP